MTTSVRFFLLHGFYIVRRPPLPGQAFHEFLACPGAGYIRVMYQRDDCNDYIKNKLNKVIKGFICFVFYYLQIKVYAN